MYPKKFIYVFKKINFVPQKIIILPERLRFAFSENEAVN